MKTGRIVVVLTFALVFIFMGGAGTVMAGSTGGGGEPGANCPDYFPGKVTYQFVTDKYKGPVTFWLDRENKVWIFGEVVNQGAGKGQCRGLVKQVEAVIYKRNQPYKEFIETTAKSLVGHCAQTQFLRNVETIYNRPPVFTYSGTCDPGSEFWEIIAVENFTPIEAGNYAANREPKFSATITIKGLKRR